MGGLNFLAPVVGEFLVSEVVLGSADGAKI